MVMKKSRLLGIVGLLGLLLLLCCSIEAWAGTETPKNQTTITLSVSGMTCAACPITIKKALKAVKGVSHVKVDFESRTATVTYDTEVVTAKELAKAVGD